MSLEDRCSILVKVKVKVKQYHYRPGQAQRVLRKLRLPDFVTTAQNGGRLSTIRTGRLYPQGILLVLISVRGRVDPRAIVSMKNPLTAGIEPATFRFVTQHLNHCATAVPVRDKNCFSSMLTLHHRNPPSGSTSLLLSGTEFNVDCLINLRGFIFAFYL